MKAKYYFVCGWNKKKPHSIISEHTIDNTTAIPKKEAHGINMNYYF